MPATRSRSTAKKRITLANLSEIVPPEDVSVLPEQTLQAILDGFSPFIAGMIQTLGMAAQPAVNPDGTVVPGDLDAAKKALDFLGKALAGNKTDRKAQDVLAEIARIRRESASDDS